MPSTPSLSLRALGFPPNRSHYIATPWSVFQDGWLASHLPHPGEEAHADHYAGTPTHRSVLASSSRSDDCLTSPDDLCPVALPVGSITPRRPPYPIIHARKQMRFGISHPFEWLSPAIRHVVYAILTRPPLIHRASPASPIKIIRRIHIDIFSFHCNVYLDFLI